MSYDTPSGRAQLEHAIEHAIALLDLLDGDSDFEPSLGASGSGAAYDAEGDDCDLELSGDEHEPDLGSFDRMIDQTKSYRVTSGTWLADQGLELDIADREPDLGSPAGGIGNQERWAQGRDAEHNGDEGEPSLGGLADTALSQDVWSVGNRDDLEEQIVTESPSAQRLVEPRCGKPIETREFAIGSVPMPVGGIHPKAFAMVVQGDCLEPQVMDGSVVIVEPVLPEVGDLGCVWPTGGKPIIKFVETPLKYGFPHNPRSEVILHVHFRMMNPPKLLAIRADKIDRIWRVSHVMPPADVVLHDLTTTGFAPQVCQ